jgi:hypothetical protein
MSVEDLPLIEQVLESGAQDRLFDGLLLAGPLVLAVIAVAGRSPLTQALAVAYIAVFGAHILRNAARRS